jgi:hypothetical protein
VRENLIVGGFVMLFILLAFVVPLAFGAVFEPTFNNWLGVTKGESRIIALLLVLGWAIKVMFDSAVAKLDRRLSALERQVAGAKLDG